MLLEILLKILSIFLLVAMGLFATKTRLVPFDASKYLNGFVLNVTVPCMIFSSMQRDETNSGHFDDMIWSFAAFAIVTLVIAVLAILITKPMKSLKDEDKGIFAFQLVFTNAGFMGYPLTTVLFGRYALFLAIIMNIVFTLLVYSLGVFLLLHKKGDRIFTMAILVRILNIPFVTSLIGLVIFITGVHFPTFINDTLELMTAAMSPIAMFVVGMNLSRSKLKNLFSLQNLLLRVNELRLELWSVAERNVAHQVELLAVGILALGYVYHRAILGVLRHVAIRISLPDTRPCQSCLIHRVAHGTYAGHWRHLHVLHLTDVEVGVGTHHRWVAAGAYVVAEHHGV